MKLGRTMAEWREAVKDVPQRIGCRTCDDVFSFSQRASEDTLHKVRCLRCGAMTLHEYPIRGTWPSEHGVGCPFETPTDQEPPSE